jgi:hypothetical protein
MTESIGQRVAKQLLEGLARKRAKPGSKATKARLVSDQGQLSAQRLFTSPSDQTGAVATRMCCST